MHRLRVLFGVAVSLIGFLAVQGSADLTELAHYPLGEEEGGKPGDAVTTIVDIIDGRDMETFGELRFSDDTPQGTLSTLSVVFDGDPDNYLLTPATPWHSFYPGFRVGMEGWVKVDSDLEGTLTVPFGNGSGYHLSIDEDGFPLGNAGNRAMPPGETPIRYGEWEHVAFWTTGSFWQVYLNGEPQHEFDALPNFNYGSPSGDATIGADRNGTSEFNGLIDEHRVFTWTGPFDPSELLFFTQRAAGDVNEDGSVNQADYDIWRRNVGVNLDDATLIEGRSLGDLNGDRSIDLTDFALIKDNKSPGVTLVIPEPSALSLAILGFMYPVWRIRRRHT